MDGSTLQSLAGRAAAACIERPMQAPGAPRRRRPGAPAGVPGQAGGRRRDRWREGENKGVSALQLCFISTRGDSGAPAAMQRANGELAPRHQRRVVLEMSTTVVDILDQSQRSNASDASAAAPPCGRNRNYLTWIKGGPQPRSGTVTYICS